MPNKNYLKGKHKEWKITQELKKEGFEIAQRSAGSHSPIDVFAINRGTREILFIQSKPNNFSEKAKQKLLYEFRWLSVMNWDVRFEVR